MSIICSCVFVLLHCIKLPLKIKTPIHNQRERERERIMLGIPDYWKGEGNKPTQNCCLRWLKALQNFIGNSLQNCYRKWWEIRQTRSWLSKIGRSLRPSLEKKESNCMKYPLWSPKKKKKVPRAHTTKEHTADQCPILHSIRQSR